MGDFNIHYKEHEDVNFTKDDEEKEKIINKFENELKLINTNN